MGTVGGAGGRGAPPPTPGQGPAGGKPACPSCRWRAPRPSPGSPSCGTAGMRRRSTALPTSATPRSSTRTSTWATLHDWSSPRSPTGEDAPAAFLPGPEQCSGGTLTVLWALPRESLRCQTRTCPAEADGSGHLGQIQSCYRPGTQTRGPRSYSLPPTLAVWPWGCSSASPRTCEVGTLFYKSSAAR